MSNVVQHSSKSVEWYTPELIVNRARHLMGAIDLDPASCLVANETVKAGMIFDVADDGLTKPWHGRVFLNPPGGKLQKTFDNDDPVKYTWVPVEKGPGESSMNVWFQRLAEHYERGLISQAFFVAFNIEILRTSQQGIPIQRYFRCYPKDRIKFVGAGDQPGHGNVLAYLPERTMAGTVMPHAFERFRNAFGDIGFCESGFNG